MSIVKQSLVGASGQGGGYTINDSLRFRRSASAYLSRTPATAGNRKTWTWNSWLKPSNVGQRRYLFSAGTNSGTAVDAIEFNTDSLRAFSYNGSFVFNISTNALFRDPSAWYMITVTFDSTQAVSSDRAKLYVNGVQQTLAGTTYPSLNATTNFINNSSPHYIGTGILTNYLDGYLTEINFIDGQALDPTDFGEFDDNGTWKPLAYTGTYGTNGFYLNGVGVTDQSGNGNNWTNNNLNLSTSTATTYDQMKDTPSLVDENAGNFATLNPLDGTLNYDPVDANLKVTLGGVVPRNKLGTMAVSSGKFYWEMFIESATTAQRMGVSVVNVDTKNNYFSTNTDAVAYAAAAGTKIIDGSSTAYGDTFTTGDTIGVALNLDDNEITFYKNGVSQGVITSKTFTGSYLPNFTHGSGSGTETIVVNFGQRPFAYTPPTGFLKLNTFNLPDSTIEDGSDYFNTVLYTGDSTSNRNIPTGFPGGWTWIKNRNLANSHTLSDVVRGDGKTLFTNAINAEVDYGANGIDFVSDGFDVTHSATNNLFNVSGRTYVAWNWKANGSGVSNTVGVIPSTVSANTEAGFSIVGYTGTGANTTVGHGLSAAPEMIIVKNRSGAYHWIIQHASLGPTKYIHFLTNAAATSSAPWNNTAPTSTVFSLGPSSLSNRNANNFIAYCFAPIEGYSSFGSYTGNGSADGPFVYTGFRPAFVIVKQSNAAGRNWNIWDNTRNIYNVVTNRLLPNANNADVVASDLDFLSNGFKIRRTGGDFNLSGATYIYMAFAENPFKNANAR